MTKIKKILLFFLLVVFVFQASSVLALEIRYPYVPGAETPNQIQEKIDSGTINQKDALPLYINYFFRFFFILAISIAIAVIIYGGVLYLISGAKPAVLVVARNWMSRGLLGLAILISSYLVLGLINPQLLTFKIERQVPPIISSKPIARSGNIIAKQNPLYDITYNALALLDETTTTEWGTYMVEIPFLEIRDMLDDVISTSNRLQEVLFPECKCGTSIAHTEWDGLKGRCVTAMDKDEEQTWWQSLKDDTGLTFDDLIKSGRNICLTRCETCGGEKTNECILKGPEGDEDNTPMKNERDHLIELLAKLQTQKIRLSADQMSLIENVLKLNQTNYLLSNLSSVTFQNDFEALKKSLEAEGYNIDIERPENLPEPRMIEMSAPAIASPTYYFFTYDPNGILLPFEIRLNKEVEEESRRLNLFSILSQLSLEDIDGMINQCFTSAFGAGNFMLDDEEFLETVKEALNTGSFDYLGNFTLDVAFGAIDNFTKHLGDKLKSRLENDVLKNCIDNCAGDEACEYKCSHPTTTPDTIPPRFLSNTLTAWLTQDIKERLPKQIKELLDQKVKEFIDLDKFFETDMLTLLDGVLQGALKKSIKDQIPFLRENLEKKMMTVLPDFISVPLCMIDAKLQKFIKNFKKTIDNKIQQIVDSLTESLGKLVGAEFSNFRSDNPDLFSEFMSEDDCIKFGGGDFNKGYYYNEEDERCCKAKPDDINSGDGFFGNPNLFIPMTGEGYEWFSCQAYCQDAGYCWYEDDSEPEACNEGGHCEQCRWIQLGDVSVANLSKALLQGLFTFSEQFMFALIETSAYTLTQFARVWVEDELIAPIQPYLDQTSGFQKKLHKFLESTIADLLPQQITQYLSSNIDQILKKVCAGKPIELYSGMEPIVITDEMKHKACHIHNEFHKTILKKLAESGDLGAEIVRVLNSEFETFLGDWWTNHKDMSFAEILFPQITNIKNLIVGTPKQIVCGELLKDYPFELKTDDGKSIVDKCNDMKSTEETYGLLPYIDYDAPAWKNLSEEKKSYYYMGCSFIWYGCNNPFSYLNKGVGWFAKEILTRECEEVDNKVKKVCDGKGCQNCLNIPEELQDGCTFCNIAVNNSIAYTLFEYAMEHNHGTIQSPDNRTTEQKQKEIRAFQWLVATFYDLRGDINTLIKDRLLYGMWTGDPLPGQTHSPEWEALHASSPAKFEDLTIAAIAWFAQDYKVHDILVSPQFGIMKYLKSTPTNPYAGDNFLSRTPYNLLYSDIVPKVIGDFTKDFPYWTISKIIGRLREGTGGPRYSPASLKKVTTADGLKVLYNIPATEVPEKRKINYIIALYLGYNPETILGIDQQLITYVKPDGLQILFHLINNELDHEKDMPVALKNLLEDYLYKKPTYVLNKLGQDAYNADPPDFETGAYLQSTANYLKTPFKTYINEWIGKDEIVKTAFDLFCEGAYQFQEDLQEQCKGWLDDTIGWEDWQKIQDILKEKPVNLIDKYITFNLIPGDLLSRPSAIDQIANGPDKIPGNDDDTVFGKRYVDTLGKALGLTKPLWKFSNTMNAFGEEIDESVLKTREAVRKGFHDAFIEAPKAGFDWIVKTLGNLVGLHLGEKTADQMVGACRPANAAGDCKTGEVYKSESKECCTISAGLVCVNRCREKGDQGCKVDEGEWETDDGQECCFPNCRKCRIATRKESQGEECLRFPDDPGKEEFINNVQAGDTLNTFDLCCWNRELKEGKEGEPDKCCVNIMDCIVDQFTFQLQLISELFPDGPPLNRNSIYTSQ